MTPKERFYNRLAGKPVDKIPNLNIVMLFAAKYAGVQYGDFCRDYRVLVEAQTKTALDFGLDILSSMSDPYREAYDYGAPVEYREDDLPVCKGPLLGGPEDIDKLALWDPMQSTRMLDRIRAIELFKKNHGETYPILGWIEGPFAEFTDLTTVSEGLMMLYDEEEFVMDAMARITEQQIRNARAQVAAGADVIGMGDAAASLVSADCYETFILPLEKKIIEQVHAAGAVVKLHICGNTSHLVPGMIESGADIVDIDYMVDYAATVKQAEGICSICGNTNPVDLILQGTPELIRADTLRCVEEGNATSLISGGCEVPKMTPPENLHAIEQTLQEIGSQ
jgi:MtaA/CmuA family methyltransferase